MSAVAAMAARLPITTFWALDITITVGVLVVAFLYALTLRNKIALRHIPSPPSWPLIGHVPTVIFGKPWEAFTKWSHKYGKIYTMHAFTKPIIIITDVEAVKPILGPNHADFKKDPWTYSVFREILGNGLVTAMGKRWKLQRSRMSPHFRFESLGNLLPIFTRAATRMRNKFEAVPAGASIDVGELYRRITLEVISEASFGFNAMQAGVLPRLFVSILDEMNLRVWYPHRKFLPSSTNFHYRKTVRELNSIVLQIVQTRRAENEARGDKPITDRTPDLLDLLLSSRVVDADAPPGTEATGMDDLQLCDELKTMLLAGHETSSMALTWALYLLVTHPEAMAKARAEVREQLPAGDGYGSMQQYKACTYLNHCLLEALRLFNPVPTIPRELVKDEVLCGKRIPAGSLITINVWGIHHSKEVWGDDAHEFRPERFDSAEARKRNPFAFLAFSAGKRNCIGKTFALLETTVLLATTIKHFDLTMKDDSKVELDSFIIPVRPKGGLPMLVTPRAVPAAQSAAQ